MLLAASTLRTTSWPGGPRFGADPTGAPIDPNGNLTQKTEGTDNGTYTWNAENQLVRVEKNGSEVARFAYDPLGRRVEKVAGGVTTSYTYDAASILREVRGGTSLTYVHGPDADEPLAAADVTLSFFHADGLGSIVKQSDATGTVALFRQYDAWGQLETSWNEAGYAFTGREWDPETALHYYRARYYDPRSGRFVSEDPTRFAADVNFYTYVLNNPVRWMDPSGLDRPGCDFIPDTPCTRQACAEHDRCYDANDCGMQSWAYAWGRCRQCNERARMDVVKCLPHLNTRDPQKPDCYDRRTHQAIPCPPPPPPTPPPVQWNGVCTGRRPIRQ